MVVKQSAQSGLIEDAKVQAFQAGLRGPLIRPGDENYDEVRGVYNGMIDKRPAFIARCANVADVIDPSISRARTVSPLRYAAVGITGPGWAPATMGW